MIFLWQIAQLDLIKLFPFTSVLHVNWNALEPLKCAQVNHWVWFTISLISVTGKWKVRPKSVSIPFDDWVWVTFYACDWLLSSVAEGISVGHTKHQLINLPWNGKEIVFRTRNKIPGKWQKACYKFWREAAAEQSHDEILLHRAQETKCTPTAPFKHWRWSDTCFG